MGYQIMRFENGYDKLNKLIEWISVSVIVITLVISNLILAVGSYDFKSGRLI